MQRLSRTDLTLLTLLTLAWGLNWPIMKIGITQFPPMLFRTLVLAGGVAVLWVWIRWRGIQLAIPRRDWGAVLLLALPNVWIWHVVSVLALGLLPGGRAAILGYTMPVWATLFALWLYGERPRPRQWLGVAAAFTGAVLLLSSEFARLAGSPLGTLLMLGAAATWGWGTVLMRRHLTAVPVATLSFWMLASAVPVVLAATLLFEVPHWRWPDAGQTFSILYNIFIAVAFCHIAWFHLARLLPPAASGLSVMMIPVLGVFSSMALLGERPYWQDYLALVLILIALTTVLLVPRAARA
jgi:drug/metabolite transporter (DMT)-like permease